jgi:hypothetical protein
MKFPYIYNPGFSDRTDPTIIRGVAIKPGSLVRVSRVLRPPMLPPCFAVIIDREGNIQSVWKKALEKK